MNVERYHLERKVTGEELDKLIRSLERNTKILKRLYFIKYRYSGISVEEAFSMIGITKMVGYEWKYRWNKLGYRGLIPRYARKGPSKLSSEQRDLPKSMLQEGSYTTAEVRSLIAEKFETEYTMKQVWSILKKWGMHHAKPYVHDKRRPPNAERDLKKPRQDHAA